MDERGRGLQFRIGPHGVVVPAVLVERVVEAELSPAPPLARAWISGLGAVDGVVFAAVDLGVGGLDAQNALCVILDTGRKNKLRWALRVTRTTGFADVTRCARPSSLPAEWPSWIAGARLNDETELGLLDVAGMARDYEK